MLIVCIFIKDVMDSEGLYVEVSFNVSKLVTPTYSTSFSIAASFLDKGMQKAIYSIYAFIRSAYEIVYTLPEYDRVMTYRIRLSESHKMALLAKASKVHKMKMV